MIFTLEILQANEGDCLLLYYGKNNDTKIIVIDGGPSGIYTRFLKPRLMEIKEAFSFDNPLPLSLVMVSHLDDDHVNGILEMTQEIADQKEENLPADFALDNIWVNTFDDIIGNIQIPVISNIPASAAAASLATLPQIANAEPHIAAVIVSTAQGRKLRDNAELISATVNNPFTPLENGKSNLVRGDGEGAVIEWDNDLKITVIHPNETRLQKLQKKWDQDLKRAKDKGDDSIIIASITDPDNSPFNLSSIVCLVEFKGKKILFTGDGRSDDIIKGLKESNLLDNNNQLQVDILKIPHHGSIRNMDEEFFKTIKADNYVISANGSDDNPDKKLLNLFSKNVSKGILHLTNHTGKNQLKNKLDTFINKINTSGNQLEINFRPDDGTIVINLLDEIQF